MDGWAVNPVRARPAPIEPPGTLDAAAAVGARPARRAANVITGQSMRGALPEPITCRLCSRSFAPYSGTRPVYCKRCAAKADRAIVKVLRVKCRECGKAFSTRNRAVRYCSPPCRDAVHARPRSAPRKSRPAHPSPCDPAKCRTCGNKFTPNWKPGGFRVYCSGACREKDKRRVYRENMRRYLEDPERRAMQVARTRAYAARRREQARKERRLRSAGA